MMWKVPKIWDRQTAAILGGGPSLSAKDVELVQRSGIHTIAVNNSFMLAPWADILYAADEKWWREYSLAPDDKLNPSKFAGTKVSIRTNTNDPSRISSDIRVLGEAGMEGLSTDPTKLVTCRNSGFQAINLAILLGATKICLLGFDMKSSPTKGHHWHGDHIPSVKTRTIPYNEWIRLITISSKDIAALGVRVINCTEGSALKCFPFQSLEDYIASLYLNS